MECLRDDFSGGVILDGRFQTISPLNHGSFGMVFMAKDLLTNKTVAVKCLTKKSAVGEAGVDFAIDDKSEELVLHRHLGRHPNIVNLIHSFETDAHIYLVLEFCEQGDLYEAIRVGQGPLETEHVRRFMLELVDAVAYIHSKGVYHRDIKPENIFLSTSGSMKLGDFGLATTEKWTYETTVGSDRYMSPEQYDSAGAGYSPAQADIWAVGICLLNILFSRNPFTAPTEADPLFLDFSRDKQSLFDVFPSMSQDTYEVIVQCMNLDPSKRSLVGARNALHRVVSFTTLDEGFDEFCCAERRTGATANREPLRTPSIQSPQVDTGAFPWAKALHANPLQPVRQLSAIPDNESYSEELFSQSEATTDWCSAQTPSLASMLDSSLGASMASLQGSRSTKGPWRSTAKVSPMAGSLPITMSKPRNEGALTLVFGRQDAVSKSWSDLWEEEVEEEEERSRQRDLLKKLNSRTWSQESRSIDQDNTPRRGLSPTAKSTLNGVSRSLGVEQTFSNDIDNDLVADGFFFHDVAPRNPHHSRTPMPLPRYSPPSKRNAIDKWAELGERRRAYIGKSEATVSKSPSYSIRTNGWQTGNCSTAFAKGAWEHHGSILSSSSDRNSSFGLHSQHHGQNHQFNSKWVSRDRVKEFPCNKNRDWTWRREKRPGFGDVEWVGGWQEAHP
ncbi:Kinase-like protein [Pleurostoma richardsiae]|uniref:non-specific serine/threonine protein kinase n=1 Tax=Pleurostoma richardsiae TaxID=41990 RepID=A0AA38RUH0_9PEZI|nr:Kinase-like protein [Pleurostoma richardsiae]